jgi:hypothetical protein
MSDIFTHDSLTAISRMTGYSRWFSLIHEFYELASIAALAAANLASGTLNGEQET